MNILLVRPRPHKDTINLQSFMICEPLELEYAAAWLEQHEHHADIVDMLLERHDLDFFLRQKAYDAVAFTAYLPHVGVVKQLAAEAKACASGITTVAAGVHAEVVPEDFNDPAIDFVLKADALQSLTALLALLRQRGTPEIPDNEAIKNAVPGVWSACKTDYAVDTAFRLPFPARHKTARYRARYNYIYHQKCATLKTSYGCPYACDFCFCTAITGNRYYERDLAEVIEEIKTIHEENIFIVDDNFLFRVERVLEFCRLLAEAGLRKNFILFGRADFIAAHPDALNELKKSGLQAVFIGIESFKEKDLCDINKKSTVAMNLKAVSIVEGLGLSCYCGIIAAPDWERKDFDLLIRHLNNFKYPSINLQPATPIPGTKLYERSGHTLAVPRERYEIWDMAHVLFTPQKMSTREFYKNIVRVYYKTSAGPKMHWFVLRRYGLKAYVRTLRGVFAITLQYIKLLRKAA